MDHCHRRKLQTDIWGGQKTSESQPAMHGVQGLVRGVGELELKKEKLAGDVTL